MNKLTRGRPKVMNETLENIALKLASKGHFDREIVEIIGVSESAFNEHKKRNKRQLLAPLPCVWLFRARDK